MTGEKIKLCRLFEKTSAKGNRYFVGRLGAARVLLFLNERADGPDPEWPLFAEGVEEADKGNGGQRRATRPTPAIDPQAPLDMDDGVDDMYR